MFMHSFDKRPLVENSQRVSAGVFARNFYLKLKQKASDDKKTLLDPKNEGFVRDLIEMIEKGSTINLKQETNGKIEFTDQNQVRMTYTRSNLGRGFVFWFICGVCGRKVRYLYIPPNSQVLACRTCHRLAYDQQNDNKRSRSLRALLR